MWRIIRLMTLYQLDTDHIIIIAKYASVVSSRQIKEIEMSKSFVLGFIVGAALLIVAGVGASRLQRRDAKQIDAGAEERSYQAEIVDATPVEFGVLTAKQRIHSSLYAGLREMRGGKAISGLVAEAKGKSKIVGTGFFVGTGPKLEPELPEVYFGKLAGESDAVISGKVMKKASQITEDDGFIFTDYEVVITKVFKNNAASPLNANATITVTRPGGKVLLDGVVVKARDDAYAPLPLNNHDVILFLKFIPETVAYKATRDTGSFELDGPTLRPLTGSDFPPGVLSGKDAFLQTIQTVSSK
jgi:hypothetical protein